MTAQIHIIGVSPHGLTLAQRELLGQSALIVGGTRLLELFGHCTLPTVSVTPLAEALPVMEESLKQGDVAVLASGDPLFFGIARRLLDHFGHDLVEVHPTLSTMQDAACRFKVSWDDARLLSLHGRSCDHVPGMLLAQPKSFVFTDSTNSPDALARDLISYLQLIGDDALLEGCQVMVAENIGTDEESLFRGSLQEAADRSFAELNVMCLLCPRQERSALFGLHEDELAHSRGLITKDEVRAATLHRLALPRKGVFWDIGAGSGSVSIEAARMNPDLVIYAVERKEEELANIKANIRRFGCYNVIPVAGLAMDVLEHLPTPQRVFIGGNGGQLPDIIQTVAHRLPQAGVLVVNGVVEKTITAAPQLMADQGLRVETSSITISRTGLDGVAVHLNPITIISGGKVG